MSSKTMKMKPPPQEEEGSGGPGNALVSAAAVQQRLKGERVQLRLKDMPGWSLVHGGTALDRAREFRLLEDAVDFAALALRMASRAKYPAQVHLDGKRVVLTLQGHTQLGARGGITDHLLDFATSLG
jgi:pterin-4a-carbinolamine dehydratase